MNLRSVYFGMFTACVATGLCTSLTAGCLPDSESPSTPDADAIADAEPADTNAADVNLWDGTIFIDAADAVAPHKPDGGGRDQEDQPGDCRGPNGKIQVFCDFNFACIMPSQVDGDAGWVSPPSGDDAADGDADAELPACAVGGSFERAPCGGFWCGPGCTCESPEKRLCACK